MNERLTEQKSIYLQISEMIETDILRGILLEGEMTLGRIDINILSEEEMAYYVRKSFLVESMKYSIIFIASLPMLIAYPFVQKYFVQGVMIGSIKG